MKKLNVLLVVMMLALLMVGCNNNEAQEPAVDNTDETPVSTFDYGSVLEENGFFKDIDAAKLVDVATAEAITIPADTHVITDEEVQAVLDGIANEHQTQTQVTDRAVASGDVVNIDFAGYLDEEAFDGGTAQGHDLTIGSGQFIPGFEDQIIGHTPGETFDVEVTFPEDYHSEDLKGKDVVFVTTINYITETEMPTMNDEFVNEVLSEVYEVTTLDELKALIQDELKASAIRTFVQNYLVSDVEVTEVPKSIVTYQEDMMINYYTNTATMYGLTLDEFLQQFMGVENQEELLSAANLEIINAARLSVVLQAVAEENKLEVSDDEIKAYFLEATGSEDYSEVEAAYGMSYIRYTILQDVVLDFLTESAVLAE